MAAYRRCLFSTASEASVQPGNEAAKKEGDTNSGKEEKSGESHQSSNAGKSVRGGPVSWLSFLLLIATGAGIVFYYDKEKRKHIEGRLL